MGFSPGISKEFHNPWIREFAARTPQITPFSWHFFSVGFLVSKRRAGDESGGCVIIQMVITDIHHNPFVRGKEVVAKNNSIQPAFSFFELFSIRRRAYGP